MKSLLIAIVLTTPTAALACGALYEYEVKNLSFAKTPIAQAISHVLAGSPYKAVIQGESDKRIAAKGISGKLDEVLAVLAKQSGMTLSLENCVITFVPEINRTLQIKPGEQVDERLTEWAARQGHTLIWQAGHYRAEAPLSLNQGLEETLEAFREAMKINKINLNISIYENRVIRILEAQ